MNRLNNISKLHKIASYVRNKINVSDTTGLCAIASHRLVRIANRLGIKCKLCVGYFGYTYGDFQDTSNQNHAWVEYGGKIIDITADQFGSYPRVMITDRKNSDVHHPFFFGKMAEKQLRYWPLEQQPIHILKKKCKIHCKSSKLC